MDIVITYVNGLDPLWQQDYQQHTNTPILEKRFRDWGTLQYLFRGIGNNICKLLCKLSCFERSYPAFYFEKD